MLGPQRGLQQGGPVRRAVGGEAVPLPGRAQLPKQPTRRRRAHNRRQDAAVQALRARQTTASLSLLQVRILFIFIYFTFKQILNNNNNNNVYLPKKNKRNIKL